MDFPVSVALSGGKARGMNSPHVVSVKLYATIFGALLLLTMATAGVAFIDLGGELNSIVALTIALGKTLLVVLFFMHVRYSSRLTWIFAGAGLFWLLILMSLTLSEVLTRETLIR
jgi:cytochrome c oxidase subunit 4